MIIEFAIHDTTLNDHEIKELYKEIISYNIIDHISILPCHIKIINQLDTPEGLSFSTPIDFPLGISSIESKIDTIKNIGIINKKISTLDIVAPTYFLSSRKYTKFRQEIKSILELSESIGLHTRYILEYRVFSYALLHKACEILSEYSVYDILPSTGYLLDDLSDNLTATVLLNKKNPKMNITCNGNIWNKNHINLLKKTQPYGIRVSSIETLKNL